MFSQSNLVPTFTGRLDARVRVYAASFEKLYRIDRRNVGRGTMVRGLAVPNRSFPVPPGKIGIVVNSRWKNGDVFKTNVKVVCFTIVRVR